MQASPQKLALQSSTISQEDGMLEAVGAGCVPCSSGSFCCRRCCCNAVFWRHTPWPAQSDACGIPCCCSCAAEVGGCGRYWASLLRLRLLQQALHS